MDNPPPWRRWECLRLNVDPRIAGDAFQGYRATLATAITTGDIPQLTNSLYSKNIISRDNLDRAMMIGILPSEKKVHLLDAIEARIRSNPCDFYTVLYILNSEGVFSVHAEGIWEKYQENGPASTEDSSTPTPVVTSAPSSPAPVQADVIDHKTASGQKNDNDENGPASTEDSSTPPPVVTSVPSSPAPVQADLMDHKTASGQKNDNDLLNGHHRREAEVDDDSTVRSTEKRLSEESDALQKITFRQ